MSTATITKVPMDHVRDVHRHLLARPYPGAPLLADWYAPTALRFFGTRLPQWATCYGAGGYLFVTSEADTYGGGPRLFTVRYQDPRGTVHTIGDFQGYKTRDAANRALAAYMASGETPPLH
jgi:hypothetical protein